MRDLARDLAVSYPTARQRFADLLAKLGLEESAHPTAHVEHAPSREAVLHRLATGELDLDEATALLNLTGAELSAVPGMLPDDTDGREDTP